MIALVLATLFNSGFSISIRFAQKRGANLTVVGAANYLTAFLLYAILALAGGLRMPHGETWVIGGVGGITFSWAFFLLHGLMKQRGVSITAAILGLSVLVPVGISLLAWGERAVSMQALGIAAAIISLPLLSIGPRQAGAGTPDAGPRRRGRSTVLLAGLFIVNGLSLVAARAFHQTGIQGEDVPFLLIIFASATLTTCLVWAFQESRWRSAPGGRPESPAPGSPAPGSIVWSALPGIVVGLCNALANRFIVVSLHWLQGIIVYPFYSAAGLLCTVITSRLAWKENITTVEMIGMGLACVSIVLINLV